MKKSEIYRKAQLAVMETEWILDDQKLQIVRTLMNDEDVAEYIETQEAKKE